MKPEDLLGKPIRDPSWSNQYFIPERIDPDFWTGSEVYRGTFYEDFKVYRVDDWFPIDVPANWVLAYDMLANQEIEKALEE
jgi:hypothetical protein